MAFRPARRHGTGILQLQNTTVYRKYPTGGGKSLKKIKKL